MRPCGQRFPWAVPWNKGRFPIFSNTTGEPYPDDVVEAKKLLAGQLANPVDFIGSIKNLYARGVRTFLEVGPGRRLAGLVESILEGHEVETIALDSSAGKVRGSIELARALARR